MLLLNVDSGRELREGDLVRLPSGSLGKVVGIDVLSESPVVVQRSDKRISQHSANDVSFLREGPNRLEPLPPIVQTIQEGGIEKSYLTCASMLCLKLTETSTTLTLIPKQPGKVKDFLESQSGFRSSFGEALLETLKSVFVSRLPHLVEFETQGLKA